MDSFSRSINLNVQPVEEGVFLASATLNDHFHDIRVSLRVREHDLTILHADGSMAWVPYPAACPNSLSLLQKLNQVSIQRGVSRLIATELGGPLGCPYLVELGIQLSRFVVITASTQLARRLILQEDNWNEFRAFQTKEMGECAGHRDISDGQIPRWLEKEKREKAIGG